MVEVDRVSLDRGSSTAVRSGVYLTTGDRSKYLFFGHNFGENGWQVNQGDIGGGVDLTAFNAFDEDPGSHRMKLVADGKTVEVFLDGASGGRFVLETTTGLHVELGAYARATGDSVFAEFDNLKVEYVLPCTGVAPSSLLMTLAETGRQAPVTIPQLLNDQAPARVSGRTR